MKQLTFRAVQSQMISKPLKKCRLTVSKEGSKEYVDFMRGGVHRLALYILGYSALIKIVMCLAVAGRSVINLYMQKYGFGKQH